jgi:hypothetical protein
MQMPVPDPVILARKAEIVRRLQEALPIAGVIHEPTETRAYECDALTAYRCPPLAVVLPTSTAEVAAAMRVCHEMGVPVGPARRGHEPRGRVHADGGRGGDRGRAAERGAGDRTTPTAASGCRPGGPT